MITTLHTLGSDINSMVYVEARFQNELMFNLIKDINVKFVSKLIVVKSELRTSDLSLPTKTIRWQWLLSFGMDSFSCDICDKIILTFTVC